MCCGQGLVCFIFWCLRLQCRNTGFLDLKILMSFDLGGCSYFNVIIGYKRSLDFPLILYWIIFVFQYLRFYLCYLFLHYVYLYNCTDCISLLFPPFFSLFLCIFNPFYKSRKVSFSLLVAYMKLYCQDWAKQILWRTLHCQLRLLSQK